ncbi:MAG: hypothetical protein NW201_10130 [Gemmatimonadales bacterium]|nr:hypothetical protein [Gemmatimonadales bacterium]
MLVRDSALLEPPVRLRKNMEMDADKLAEVRRLLGVRTDTEAVDRALDLVLFQERLVAAIDAVAAAGGVADVFGHLDAPAAAPARARRKRKG